MRALLVTATTSILLLTGCASNSGFDGRLYGDLAHCADGTTHSLSAPPPYCAGHGGVVGTLASAARVDAYNQQVQQIEATQAAIQNLNQTLNQINSQTRQSNQNTLNQLQGYMPPPVAPSQSSGTAIVYCRDLTGNIITCKKIN